MIAALGAIDTSVPTIVPGAANKASSLGYRFLPRRLMLRIAQRNVK